MMSGMFFNAIAFNQELGKWSTSRVTDLSLMFMEASVFNQEVGRWDTSQVTDMSGMFENAAAFNGDLRKWNTSRVTRMDRMFYDATAFNCDISGWNVCSARSMTDMFCRAHSFSFINLLKAKWAMLPVACGSSTRQVTAGEVNSCLSKFTPLDMCSQLGTLNSKAWHRGGPSTFLFVGALLAILFLFVCLRGYSPQALLKRRMEVGLTGGSQPLLREVELACLSVSTVQRGQYVRVVSSDEALLSACHGARLSTPCHDDARLVLKDK
eukprot:2407107-Amphidinium_carterae.1